MKDYKKKRTRMTVALFFYCAFFLTGFRETPTISTNALVRVQQTAAGWQLMVRNEPYFIKGAAVVDACLLRSVKAAGGNSVRLYTLDHAAEVLDSAYALGMTVTLGIVLPYADKDFDYNNTEDVERHLEATRRQVLRFKDHPALLMWGIGNEPFNFMNGDLGKIVSFYNLTRHINNISRMIHRLDGNHPTTTMLADGQKRTMQMLSLFGNDLDLLSVNAFRGIDFLPETVQYFGWEKPIMISEFGGAPYWVAPQTEWMSKIEQPSTIKNAHIIEQYRQVEKTRKWCVGSYAFIWDFKQEYSTTWFSMFLPDDQPTETTDAMQFLWSGRWPVRRAPGLTAMIIDGRKVESNIYLKPGQQIQAQFWSPDPQGDSLQLRYEIQADGEYLDAAYGSIGYGYLVADTLAAGELQRHPDYTPANPVYSFSFTTPKEEGPYRLMLYLSKKGSTVSTANGVFYVHD